MMRRMALSGAAAILVLLALRFAAAQANDGSNTLVLSVPSNQWFEGPGVQVSISSDGNGPSLRTDPPCHSFHSRHPAGAGRFARRPYEPFSRQVLRA